VILHDITREKKIEKLKTEFISLVAHQLRTPLSAIKWALEMLLESEGEKLPLEQKDLLEKAYQSNERMILLIKDLLDVTKLEEGKYIFSFSLEDLEEITQEVIDSYQKVIQKKNLKFEFQKPIDEKLPKVKVDREKIKLAIENLIDNAIKYTPAGGKVTVSLESDKLKLELRVEDSGIGIAKNQQERVFSKFFRTSKAMQMEPDGSGLGLYLAKNIIEAHKGEIGFQSKEGQGSIFWFTLPLKEKFEEILERF
jgi:signal transduction histidine kinase